jgi:hypothetical protein
MVVWLVFSRSWAAWGRRVWICSAGGEAQARVVHSGYEVMVDAMKTEALWQQLEQKERL